MTKTREMQKEQIIRIMGKVIPVIQNNHFSNTSRERKLYSNLQNKLNNL